MEEEKKFVHGKEGVIKIKINTRFVFLIIITINYKTMSLVVFFFIIIQRSILQTLTDLVMTLRKGGVGNSLRFVSGFFKSIFQWRVND